MVNHIRLVLAAVVLVATTFILVPMALQLPAGANPAPTGCPAPDTCSLFIKVANTTSGSCQYGCPTSSQIQVTAYGADQENTGAQCISEQIGCYIPSYDFIVIYEVPTSGSTCTGVVGSTNGCTEVQSCPQGQAVCSITLNWGSFDNCSGACTTHVFEAWTINTFGYFPDYCSGKSPWIYSTSYLYAYNGGNQIATTQNPLTDESIYEAAASVPDGTTVTVQTYADDPPFYDSNFSTYDCGDTDTLTPPGVEWCSTLPSSYTYPNNQQFENPSGFSGCNSKTIPPPPGFTWPSPLSSNGPYAYGSPQTHDYISTQAVYITDPTSNNATCMSNGSAPAIGPSNWLSLSWYCPVTVSGVSAYSGSGQSAVDGTSFAHPLQALVTSSCTGQGLPGTAVTFSLPAGDATFAGGGTSETDVTNASGVATSSTVTAGNTPASYSAQASDAGYTASFALTDSCNATWGTSVTASSGASQSTLGGNAFALPLKATVLNQCGGPLQGATVKFTLPSQYASFSGGTSAQNDSETTSSSGVATSATVVANSGLSALGTYLGQATASFSGPFSPQGPANYQLTNTCNGSVPASMSIAGGNDQQTSAGGTFVPLSVSVLSQCGTGWSGGTVTFTGPSGTTVPTVGFVTTTTKVWTSAEVDTARDLVSVSCTSATFCIAVDASDDYTTWNGTSWSTPASTGATDPLTSVSCTIDGQCDAVTSGTYQARFWTGSGWTGRTYSDLPAAGSSEISCVQATATYSQCVTVGTTGGKVGRIKVYESSSTTGGGSVNTLTASSGPLVVGCFSKTYQCIVADAAGHTWETDGGSYLVQQTGGGSMTSTEAPVTIDTGHKITAIACPAATLCVLTDNVGNYVIASITGTKITYSAARSAGLANGAFLQSISCVSATYCMGVSNTGKAYLWKGSGSWSANGSIFSSGLTDAISCGVTTSCVVVNTKGDAARGPSESKASTTTTAVTSSTGVATTSTPYAGSVAGAVTVVASITSSTVTPVRFTLYVTTGGSSTSTIELLPTSLPSPTHSGAGRHSFSSKPQPRCAPQADLGDRSPSADAQAVADVVSTPAVTTRGSGIWERSIQYMPGCRGRNA
jgi:hypothetical protein